MVDIKLIVYSKDEFIDKQVSSVKECAEYLKKKCVVWVDIIDLGEPYVIEDPQVLEDLKNDFGLHPLALEDCVHIRQRAKVEDYETNLFMVARTVSLRENDIESAQHGIFLGPNFVITIHYGVSQRLECVKDVLRKQKHLRQKGADYLCYMILDSIIDSFYDPLEIMGDEIENIEEEVINTPNRNTLKRIQNIKSSLLILRKTAWPQREMLAQIQRGDFSEFKKETRTYILDVYDHMVQIMDIIETQREVISGSLDAYLTSVSNTLNEIMKVLTIISVIILPMSLIASIYGMNFDPDASPFNMPELRWAFGYPFAIGLMLSLMIIMLLYFKKKKWI